MFTSDSRTAQMGGNQSNKVLQHQLFVGIMEKLAISAKGKTLISFKNLNIYKIFEVAGATIYFGKNDWDFL